MKKDNTATDNHPQPVGGLQPNIKRIRTQPRHKIRQLLRSFLPLEKLPPGKPLDQDSP